jgi:hypothetical protein
VYLEAKAVDASDFCPVVREFFGHLKVVTVNVSDSMLGFREWPNHVGGVASLQQWFPQNEPCWPQVPCFLSIRVLIQFVAPAIHLQREGMEYLILVINQ